MKDYYKAEKIVYNYFSSKKGSYICRFLDTHDINSQLRRFGEKTTTIFEKQKPSDFIIIDFGYTYFAEVKTTENVRGVTAALFKEQKGQRERILKCRGEYQYFIYSFVNKCWYSVPGSFISEKPTRSWEELFPYKIIYLEDVK